jgi:hypothetical protein
MTELAIKPSASPLLPRTAAIKMREDRPDLSIQTKIIHMDFEVKVACAQCSLIYAETPLAMAHATAGVTGDFVRKAEQKAITAALALLGYEDDPLEESVAETHEVFNVDTGETEHWPGPAPVPPLAPSATKERRPEPAAPKKQKPAEVAVGANEHDQAWKDTKANILDYLNWMDTEERTLWADWMKKTYAAEKLSECDNKQLANFYLTLQDAFPDGIEKKEAGKAPLEMTKAA